MAELLVRQVAIELPPAVLQHLLSSGAFNKSDEEIILSSAKKSLLSIADTTA
jgi:hypothetical protein